MDSQEKSLSEAAESTTVEFSLDLKKLQALAKKKLLATSPITNQNGPDFENWGNFDANEWGNFDKFE